MKTAIILGTLMSVFFITNVHAESKKFDNVPGIECEQGEHKFNPHCNPIKTPKPPEIIKIPIPTPICTPVPQTTEKPVAQESGRPKETHEPTPTPSSTPVQTSTPTANPTPTPNSSPYTTGVPSAEPTDSPRPTQEVRTDLTDGRSDGRTESLGCLKPEDGCTTGSKEPQVLGYTLPETGRIGFWGYASFFGAFFILGLGIYLRFKSFKEDDK